MAQVKRVSPKETGAFVFIADAHLHTYRLESRNNGQDRLEDGLIALNASLELARERRCPWIFGGDFKVPRTTWPQDALNGALGVLSRYADVPKLMVNGNHDGDTDHGCGLRPFSPYATIIDKPSVIDFQGMPLACWPADSDFEAYPTFLKAAEVANARTLIAHLFCLGAFLGPDEVRLPGQGHPLEKLGVHPKGQFSLGCFGDIHKGQVWVWSKPAPGQWVPFNRVKQFALEGIPPGTAIYPGSPYAQNWGEREDGRKGCLLVDLGANRITFHDLPGPKFIVADWTHTAPKAAAPEWEGNFVRLRVSTPVSDKGKADLLAKWKPRTLSIEVEVPEESTARITDFHAALPQGEIVEKYVEARPLAGVAPKNVILAGKHLMQGE